MTTSISLRFPTRASAGHGGLERILGQEFPTVAAGAGQGATVMIDAPRWAAGDIDLYAFDAAIDDAAARGQVTLRIEAVGRAALRPTAVQVITRCQRWLDRRNEGSTVPLFDRVLDAHRRLHDLRKPLVQADYRHALDVWQWLVRIAPSVGLAEQIAALFHDIERLATEADRRIEHHAADYDAFKHAHARAGARMAHEVLRAADVPSSVCDRVASLVERHEARPAEAIDEAELGWLNDADGLSFFSLNSGGFLDYYGEAHARRKIAWTLRRLGPAARARLTTIHLRPDVAALLDSVTASDGVTREDVF